MNTTTRKRIKHKDAKINCSRSQAYEVHVLNFFCITPFFPSSVVNTHIIQMYKRQIIDKSGITRNKCYFSTWVELNILSGFWRCIRSSRHLIGCIYKKGRQCLDYNAHAWSELRFILNAESCHCRKLHRQQRKQLLRALYFTKLVLAMQSYGLLQNLTSQFEKYVFLIY